MTRVALLQAYSPLNSGDGLLVEEARELVGEVLGPDVDIDVFASRASDFEALGLPRTRCISTKPTLRGYDRQYLRALRHLSEYDVIVGVGGGYLRFGHPIEAMKSWLVHVPQLAAAVRGGRGAAIYLPQSCGPFGPVSRHVVPRLLGKVGYTWLRDDRSLQECGFDPGHRAPDCALLNLERTALPFDAEAPVVVGTRALRGGANATVARLAAGLGTVDGLVQSRVGANDDGPWTSRITTGRMLDQQALSELRQARVVVSVRMHGAIMALSSGHYVIHLSYERKGFGAFDDLGLPEYVHNVHSFDPEEVAAQVGRLRDDPRARKAYDDRVTEAIKELRVRRQRIVNQIATAGGAR